MSWSMTFENMLSIRVLECLVKIKGVNELEARKSKKSYVWLCSL